MFLLGIITWCLGYPKREKKNGEVKRGSVHPSGDEIKVVTETRSKQQEKSSGI